MNKETYKISAQLCLNAYSENIDLGSGTQIRVDLLHNDQQSYRMVSIAGTNELRDWGGNFSPFVWRGMKAYAYRAATRISKYIKENYNPFMCEIIAGHSRGCPVAISYKRRFAAQHCICFSPARSLAPWVHRTMANTTLFIDPDDPVSAFPKVWWSHPDCEIIRAPDDHKGWCVGDHGMENWIKFVNNMEE